MNNKVPRTPFSTPLSGSAREAEIRLRNIFSGPKKRPPLPFLILVFSVCVFCGNLVSCHMAEVPEVSLPVVRSVPVNRENPPSGEDEEWLLQALFLAADGEEPFQLPEAGLLACVQGDGCFLGAVFVEDHLENTLLLGVVDGETHELTGPLFRYAVRNGTPEVVAWQQDGSTCLLYTFNGRIMSETGQAGLVRFDGKDLAWVWPVEGDVREAGQAYRDYWTGHLARLVPGGVDVYTANPDFVYGEADPALLWQFDHREVFYSAPENEAARSAYVRVLEDLLCRSTTPDGWIAKDSFEDMSANTFALADVDGDGREELVLLTRPDIYAGYMGYILDYDAAAGNVRIQFEGFPSLTFYSNGTLTEDDSHAQGSWTETFWPYSLYRYLPETDSYEEVGHVGAWEKSFTDYIGSTLPPFPTEKDISGAGILYYIPAINKGTYHDRINMAVDQSVYLEWLEPYLGDAQPLEPDYLPLTEENIARIKQEEPL